MTLYTICRGKAYSPTEWVEAIMTGEVTKHDKYTIKDDGVQQ